MATIGIDASRANSSERTGTEWYIYNVLQQFKRIIPAEHTVILYTQDPVQEDMLPLPDNWRVQVLRWPPKLLWTQLRMSLTMLWPWSRPDVLFIPAHTVPIIHPKRSIYVAHDLGFERMAEIYGNQYIGGGMMNALIRVLTLGKYGSSELDYHRWSMKFAVNHAADIIAISEFTKSELADIFGDNLDHVTVVHNGFSRNQYFQIDDVQPSNDPGYFLHVGRVELKKNIPNLIEAYADYVEASSNPKELWLAGTPGFGYEEIEQVITKRGVEDKVKMLGYVPSEEMNLLMNRATAFVFPTHYEGFGIPVLEAMSAGTRVVCSDIPALREVAESAATFFDQHAVQSITAALIAVDAETVDERGKYIEAGLLRVQSFSWQKCAEQTWNVLEKHIQ